MPKKDNPCNSSRHFLPKFIKQFLPKRNNVDSLDDRHFTRERRLTLEITLSLLLNMVRPGQRDGYQKVIDRFFSETGLAFQTESNSQPPDKSAFCRARRKIPVDILQVMFDKAVTLAESLARENTALSWNGFRVYAIDGTKKNLPNSPELRAYFDAPSGANFPQMITGVLFDVLAKIPANFMRGPFWINERAMALELVNDLGPGDLLILDRGYPGYVMFRAMIKQGVDFLVRLPKDGLFKEATEFLALGKRDGKITIHPTKNVLKKHPGEELPPLTLRIVRVSIPGSKDHAVFVTTLMNRKKYPPKQLRDLYHLRWNEEEFFKTIKEQLRAEEFRGHCVQFIDQELMATYIYYTLTRILSMESAKLHNIPIEHIETKSALLAVSRYLDRLFLAETINHCKILIQHCLWEISWRTYRPRPGRTFPRKSKNRYGKWACKWS